MGEQRDKAGAGLAQAPRPALQLPGPSVAAGHAGRERRGWHARRRCRPSPPGCPARDRRRRGRAGARRRQVLSFPNSW